MPLNQSSLASALADVAANPPPTSTECAQAWADAVGSYASSVVPPSTTVSEAKSVLATSLASAFASPAAAPLMETAFAAFAASVGLGMAPLMTASPPPAPVGFATLFLGPKPVTHAEAGSALAAKVDLWMKTGTATPSSGGSPSPWS